MRQFISAALACAAVLAWCGAGFAAAAGGAQSAAQAEKFKPQINVWQAVPPRHKAEQAQNSGQGQKPRKKREQIRLQNVKDKQHRLMLACGVNSGRLNLAAAFPKQEGATAEKGKTAPLSVAIDGKPVLTAKAKYGRASKNAEILRAALHGDDTVRFISAFLSAKSSIAVSLNGQSASYSAAQAGQAGLALQNCLHK